jgi:hypothetical protein
VEASTEFELAQKRLVERQRTHSSLFLWLTGFVIVAFFHLVFGQIGTCWFALEILCAVMVAGKAIRLQQTMPLNPLQIKTLEQEMEWLFGADWRQTTDVQESAFAEERVQKRRADRIGFAIHFLIFLAAAMSLMLLGDYFWKTLREPLFNSVFNILPLGWLVFALIPHAWRTFPTPNRLARRENRVGQALQAELQRLHLEKHKNDEKPKRTAQYMLGDDGELIEWSEEADDTQKRKLDE